MVAYNNLRPIPLRKQFILLQRTVEHIDALRLSAFKFSVEYLQLASLLARAHQTSIYNRTVIRFQHLCGALFCFPINFLIAGRQKNQDCDKQNAHPNRSLILNLFFCKIMFHGRTFLTAKKRTKFIRFFIECPSSLPVYGRFVCYRNIRQSFPDRRPLRTPLPEVLYGNRS